MLLNDFKLYVILDRSVNSYERLFEIAVEVITAGVDIVQLRDKNGSAKEILEFSKRILEITKAKVPYIINDRVDLAMLIGAAGVHLGQEDIPVKAAREMMGKSAIIGASCQTLEHARRAQEDGADYIGFGSVYKTLTKPDREPMDLEILQNVLDEVDIPVFAIGGIDLENIDRIRTVGVERVAVCRAICEAEDVGGAVRSFKASLDGADVLQ